MRLKELASVLGLSATQVSRALAGYPDVSAVTRERVAAAAQAHSYVPNRAGRMLVSGRSDFVGMLLPLQTDEIIDAYLGEFIVGLADGLTRRGRDLFLAAVPKGQDDLTVLRHLVDSQRADAVVIYRVTEDDPRARFLIDRRIPFVAHGRMRTPAGRYAWFDTDDTAAFARVTRQLIALGHRRFAVFGPKEPFSYARFRRDGVSSALAEAGLALAPEAEIAAPVADREAVARAADQLLQLDPRPTAVFGLKDQFALAVLGTAHRTGLRVPKDLSVIGFGDVPVAAYADPPLSTFAQKARAGAETVAEMVIDGLEHGIETVEPRLVDPEFIARASHGPAPSPRRRKPRAPRDNAPGEASGIITSRERRP